MIKQSQSMLPWAPSCTYEHTAKLPMDEMVAWQTSATEAFSARSYENISNDYEQLLARFLNLGLCIESLLNLVVEILNPTLYHGLAAEHFNFPKTKRSQPICYNPILPEYMRYRHKLAQPPAPFQHNTRLYDIMGMTSTGELLLRDEQAIHRDVRIESLTGHTVILKGVEWKVVSLENVPSVSKRPRDAVLKLRLGDPRDSARTVTLSGADAKRVVFPSPQGQHSITTVRHGIVRLASIAKRTTVRKRLEPGRKFEARLRGHEIKGSISIQMGNDGRLLATEECNGNSFEPFAIEAGDIAPRYQSVVSPDFGFHFDVDSFLYHEDCLRGKAFQSQAEEIWPTCDSTFNILPDHTSFPLLTSGAEHLGIFETFIRSHTQCPVRHDSGCISVGRRKLTILNLSMSDQGDALGVLDAVVNFRRHNKDADITIVVSKLGPGDYQETPDYHEYLKVLTDNSVRVDSYLGEERPVRQINHAKAILIDDHVLFSTGAVMDTQPINKADFSIELPHTAASKFRSYTDEAILQDASYEQRAILVADLAKYGVVINDPVAGLTYISRAQDSLISGAKRKLVLSISELVDASIAQTLVTRAAAGIDVTIQVRELDDASAQVLAEGTKEHPDRLKIEDVSWWEPRPHFNVIIADDEVAYLGSAYLWPTQRNMIHHGRSLENGVLLNGDAVASILVQLYTLGACARGSHLLTWV